MPLPLVKVITIFPPVVIIDRPKFPVTSNGQNEMGVVAAAKLIPEITVAFKFTVPTVEPDNPGMATLLVPFTIVPMVTPLNEPEETLKDTTVSVVTF